jgi:monofunctional biosynthetic peptidoglycan transglycosylase
MLRRMASTTTKSKSRSRSRGSARKPERAGASIRQWLARLAIGGMGTLLFLILLFAILNPIRTPYMISEGFRLGGVKEDWVSIENIAPEMARSVVAAEDANFCEHWGFDMAAIRNAISKGSHRGASTISQQVVKNVYLWQGRSWLRKALEAGMTPLLELVWTKRRILEVYLNVAEFGEGVFGVGAASQEFFGVTPDKLTPTQAARLAAVLPDPKDRSARKPSAFVRSRARAIEDGAATIEADGRATCFEG